MSLHAIGNGALSDSMDEFFRFSLANINIEVECHDRLVFRQCRDYLSSFDAPDILISSTQEEIEAEEGLLGPIAEDNEGVATSRHHGYSESIVVQRKIADGATSFDSILMHGAVVALDGFAYMFTAPSGTGKSTRAKLWLEEYPESIVVNGDKPLIKVTGGEAIAFGTPWCGKEGWNANIAAPLRAIFLLERADSDRVDSIERVTPNAAFPALLRQAYRPTDSATLRKTLYLVSALSSIVDIYRFKSTPTRESVRLAFECANAG